MEKATLTACGDKVSDNSIFVDHNNKRIYFCEAECKTEFLEDPDKFFKSDHFLISFDLLEDV